MSSYLRVRSGSVCGSRGRSTGTAKGLCENPTRVRCGAVTCTSSVHDMPAKHRLPRFVHRRRRWAAGLLLIGLILEGTFVPDASVSARPTTSTDQRVASRPTADPTSDLRTRDPRLPTEDPAAAEVIKLMLAGDGARAIAAVPADFATRMGYQPILEGAEASNPDGGCSSPVPMPDEFEPLCRTHDLGYDTLRYADRIGHPLGAWARLGLDTMLVSRMRETCHDPLCAGAAEMARVGLAMNTWNEGDGPPKDRANLLSIAASAISHLVHSGSEDGHDGARASSEMTR